MNKNRKIKFILGTNESSADLVSVSWGLIIDFVVVLLSNYSLQTLQLDKLGLLFYEQMW